MDFRRQRETELGEGEKNNIQTSANIYIYVYTHTYYNTYFYMYRDNFAYWTVGITKYIRYEADFDSIYNAHVNGEMEERFSSATLHWNS